MTDHFYGEGPEVIGNTQLPLPLFTEFMHYLYLPIRIPMTDPDWHGNTGTGVPDNDGQWFRLPQRLEFLDTPVVWAIDDATEHFGHEDFYVYITARRGFATPGNPLNRPGWHCDDFGGTDLNYIWMDNYPTRALRSDVPLSIPEDDVESMEQMEWLAAQVSSAPHYRAPDYWQRQLDEANVRIEEMPTNTLLKLSPYVIHAAPEIIEPGMRSFFKISISSHRYDLVGNSHNHELSYDWPMYDRQELRNQPGAFQNKDYSGVAQ